MITLILLGGFTVLMMIRVPVAMSIGASVLVALLVAGYPSELYIIANQVLQGVDNASLQAVPFFILAGNLMNAVGFTTRLFDFASKLVGHWRAGLAQVLIVAEMVLSGVSGSAVSDCAAIGTIAFKAMPEAGYTKDFAAAISVTASILGPIIPPSIALIVYSYLSDTSVARLFLGGIVPGIVCGLAVMIYIRIVAERLGIPRTERASVAQVVRAGYDAVLALVAPGIIMGAILTGYATATEAGVLACVYSLLLGVIYRTISWCNIWEALTNSMAVSVVIMMIIGFSTVLGWIMAIEQIPQQLVRVVMQATDNRAVFLAILLVFFLFIGCFIEGVPAKIILVPILLPLIDHFGIDRVHFGLIITFAIVIGVATPPMGVCLYIMVGIGRLSFERVTRAVMPMLIPVIIVLIVITYFPAFTLWLPNLILGTE